MWSKWSLGNKELNLLNSSKSLGFFLLLLLYFSIHSSKLGYMVSVLETFIWQKQTELLKIKGEIGLLIWNSSCIEHSRWHECLSKRQAGSVRDWEGYIISTVFSVLQHSDCLQLCFNRYLCVSVSYVLFDMISLTSFLNHSRKCWYRVQSKNSWTTVL